jgi:hypothetical protein
VFAARTPLRHAAASQTRSALARADLGPPLLAAPEVAPAAPRLPRHSTDYIVPLSPNLSTVTFSASYVCRANFV